MERGEDFALALGLRQADRQDGSAMRTFDARQLACLEVKPRGVGGMNVERRLALMRHQARQPPGAGHGVPLVAQPSGIEEERPLIVGRRGRRPVRRRHEAGAAIGRGEAFAVAEQPFSRQTRRAAAAKPSASAHRNPHRSSRRARQYRRCGDAAPHSRIPKARHARGRSPPDRHRQMHRPIPCAAPPPPSSTNRAALRPAANERRAAAKCSVPNW